jgi:DNA repair protein RadC
LGDPTLSQAGVQMTKAIIDIAGPLGIFVPDYIMGPQEQHAGKKG